MDSNDAKISVFDRGFLFGDSIYEVTDAYDYTPLFIEEHLDRLWVSASKIFMPITFTRSELKIEIEKTLKKLNEKRAYIRLIITRGEGEITLDPTLSNTNNLIIICKKLNDNPSWWYSRGVEVIVANTLRNSSLSMDPSIKSGNYLNNILAYNEAVTQGAYDAVMLNHEGHVTEGTTNNIWMIKDGVIKTPPLKAGLLSGITRAKLLEICKENNMKFLETNITETEFKEADEAFLTSSTKRIVPIVKVGDKVIGNGKPGTQTLLLLSEYLKKFNLRG